MDRRSLIIVFESACIPLALLIATGLVTWRFRRLIGIWTNKASENIVAPRNYEPAIVAPPLSRLPLVLRRVKASEVGLATGEAGVLLSAAEATTRYTRLAYIISAFSYSAVTTFALTAGHLNHFDLPAYAGIVHAYLMQWPPLLILISFLGFSLRLRFAILGGYLLIGLPLAAVVGLSVLSILWQQTVLWPMAGLILLLARPLRPWLVGLVAILLFLLIMSAVGFVLRVVLGDKVDMSRIDPRAVVGGAVFLITGVVYFGLDFAKPPAGNSSRRAGVRGRRRVVSFLAAAGL